MSADRISRLPVQNCYVRLSYRDQEFAYLVGIVCDVAELCTSCITLLAASGSLLLDVRDRWEKTMAVIWISIPFLGCVGVQVL